MATALQKFRGHRLLGLAQLRQAQSGLLRPTYPIRVTSFVAFVLFVVSLVFNSQRQRLPVSDFDLLEFFNLVAEAGGVLEAKFFRGSRHLLSEHPDGPLQFVR